MSDFPIQFLTEKQNPQYLDPRIFSSLFVMKLKTKLNNEFLMFLWKLSYLWQTQFEVSFADAKEQCELISMRLPLPKTLERNVKLSRKAWVRKNRRIESIRQNDEIFELRNREKAG